MPKSRQRSAKADPILTLAREKFGYSELRPGQREGIESVISGRDTLVIAPTGSGKSAVYQIAGLLLEGIVLVISPLIALQKDQVDSIQDDGICREAVVINSALKKSELEECLDKVKDGSSKFVFLAPEQLAKPETLDPLLRGNIALIVVDEAHCVTEWGHDFRPHYLQLKHAIDRLQHPTVLAMTATASPHVREQISSSLGMTNPNVLVNGFDRPNIFLRVDRFDKAEKKLEALTHRVRWSRKPGIIYVATRKEAESIMAGLDEEGISSLFYHGGLKPVDRESIQNRFMDGEAEVIVATNAFGMGIDKADIRFVYHYDVPDSLDAYYQEIGRCGRDGERAEAVLFFRDADIGHQAFHTGSGKVKEADLETVVQALDTALRGLTVESLVEKTAFSKHKLTGLLHKLEQAGAIRYTTSGLVKLSRTADVTEAAVEANEQEKLLKESRQARLEEMRAYAESNQCRRQVLLRHFGEQLCRPCLQCDNCEAQYPDQVIDDSVGMRVEVA